MPNVYTILLCRGADEDDPSSHGNNLSGPDQVAAELQEAMNASGLPVGFFQVVGVENDVSWDTWDQMKLRREPQHKPPLRVEVEDGDLSLTFNFTEEGLIIDGFTEDDHEGTIGRTYGEWFESLT